MTLAMNAPAPAIRNMDEDIRWCKMMADGDMLPRQYRGKPANLMFAADYAAALDLPRITVLTGIHVIEGKPSASADLIGSLVRKAGHRLRVQVEGTGINAVATATIVRADDPEFEYKAVWNWKRAEDAKLIRKDNWANYPQAMMKARAITEVAREAASEALFGIVYTPEELGATVNASGEILRMPTQQQPEQAEAPAEIEATVEVQEAPAQPQDEPGRTADAIRAELSECTTRSDVEALWREARAAGYADLVDDIEKKGMELVNKELPPTPDEPAPEEAEQPTLDAEYADVEPDPAQ